MLWSRYCKNPRFKLLVQGKKLSSQRNLCGTNPECFFFLDLDEELAFIISKTMWDNQVHHVALEYQVMTNPATGAIKRLLCVFQVLLIICSYMRIKSWSIQKINLRDFIPGGQGIYQHHICAFKKNTAIRHSHTEACSARIISYAASISCHHGSI